MLAALGLKPNLRPLCQFPAVEPLLDTWGVLALIAARIRRLAAEKDVPVVAFCEDIAASGGYWLATAGDEIYADDNSIVGSIGVIYAGFGFHALLERQGIERRVHTAGQSKSMLDPFKPEREEDVERIKALQTVIHDTFIAQVKTRREGKLVDRDLFTGGPNRGQSLPWRYSGCCPRNREAGNRLPSGNSPHLISPWMMFAPV